MKRFLRSPIFWIAVAVVGVLVALQYLVPNGGYKEIDTSTMAGYINDGTVETVTFTDGDQEIRATLDDGSKVLAYWVDGQQNDLIKAASDGVDNGDIDDYNSENPQPGFLMSFLPTLIMLSLIHI